MMLTDIYFIHLLVTAICQNVRGEWSKNGNIVKSKTNENITDMHTHAQLAKKETDQYSKQNSTRGSSSERHLTERLPNHLTAG